MHDYFVLNLMYDVHHFQHWFRMWHSFFLRIVVITNTHYLYFAQKQYARGAMGLPIIHKCIVAIRMLTYGMAINTFNEYVHIGKSTMESLKCFCWMIKEVFQTHVPLTTHYITNFASYNLIIEIVQNLFILNLYISRIDILH
jgi:hypothetical protein